MSYGLRSGPGQRQMAGGKDISDRRPYDERRLLASKSRRGLLADLSVGMRINLLIALAFGALAALGGVITLSTSECVIAPSAAECVVVAPAAEEISA